MAPYNKKKIISASVSQIPLMAETIRRDFELEGFEVSIDTLMNGGRDISLTKGNLFHAVLGMRTALKIVLTPHADGVLFDANVGIFGQQAIPAAITMFLFWPVILTQIWGLIEQASLDDRALESAERSVAQPNGLFTNNHMDSKNKFCTQCGNSIPEIAKFCPVCGGKQ